MGPLEDPSLLFAVDYLQWLFAHCNAVVADVNEELWPGQLENPAVMFLVDNNLPDRNCDDSVPPLCHMPTSHVLSSAKTRLQK